MPKSPVKTAKFSDLCPPRNTKLIVKIRDVIVLKSDKNMPKYSSQIIETLFHLNTIKHLMIICSAMLRKQFNPRITLVAM